MTKVSKVYFGLSRVSSRSRGPRRLAAGRRTGAGSTRGESVDIVDMVDAVGRSSASAVRLRARLARRGWALTVTASRISRPKALGERVLELAAQPALELGRG